MSTTAEAPTTPGHAQAAAALLAAVNTWHTTHPAPMLVPPQLKWVAKRFPVRYDVTEAGLQALAALAADENEEGAA